MRSNRKSGFVRPSSQTHFILSITVANEPASTSRACGIHELQVAGVFGRGHIGWVRQ